ncbi:phosphoadenosine phosphosulfate reductase family protein [Mesorhizobium sp. B1-1-6]|uniref:phosphoadenosine phosphosulfate reductase domain-containing protein n=1 Tax=Mesorhizobium sp. B1-1-6 TaxID=2589978 RepID=UPI00112A5B50|nr:phosphoadenosine phosphosulfate reductase family protein [Mesorhizobium sp. B1-1-6]TPN34774.1 phosphoadenosine phosphosulfate reductase family protein [Mesorhizobium sp. B1-1-6]
MPVIASVPAIDELIAAGSPVAIGVSGGKDSQAAALATVAHLDRIGHAGPRLLIHSDLGIVEWSDSHPMCDKLADHIGIDLVVVRRKAGGLMERWESRWESSRVRYETLSTVTLVPCWSTPDMRFCTSEMKTHIIVAELHRRFKGQTVINVTGIRRQESRKRAMATVATRQKDGRMWDWRPIIDWTVDEVFAEIDRHGLHPHPAYRGFGMSRVSCRFCIMSNLADIAAAAAQPEAHDLYRRMVGLESTSSFGFQGARWLGDIAPHLLDAGALQRFADGKIKALHRIAAEARIAPGMLYVKGWPTRMLTDAEADILAETRSRITNLFGFSSACLDRASIHHRYSELLAEHERRAA